MTALETNPARRLWPVPDERFIALSVMEDDLRKLFKQYSRRDEAQGEIRSALEHLTQARKILQAAYNLICDEFSSINGKDGWYE